MYTLFKIYKPLFRLTGVQNIYPVIQHCVQVKPVCPLCKGKFSYIMHKIVSDTEYER